MRHPIVNLGVILCALTAAGVASAAPTDAHHARGASNMFWFLHISDLHIGSFEAAFPDGPKHLEFALIDAVDVIQPAFVLATGDLVDGSKNLIPTAGQEQAEWDLYKQIYGNAGMTPTFYFDLIGNHDAYNDTGLGFYLANSLLGQTWGKPYTSWIVDIPAGEYLFFGLNSAGNGVPPFSNPVGNFTDDEIIAVSDGLTAHPNARLVFLSAHHEIEAAQGGDDLLGLLESVGGGFYMRGHAHGYSEHASDTGPVVINEINTLGKGNNDNLGVAVIDHDALIYRATSTATPWPHVIVTAPVSAELRSGGANPFAYSVCKDRVDNPVRAVVFADAAPSKVEVQIDGAAAVPMTASAVTPGVFEGVVDTTALTAGTHEIRVNSLVGSVTASDSVVATFVDGPCDPLPEDAPPAQDAGVDGQAGSGGASDGGGSGGSGGVGGSGASGGTGGAGGAAASGGSGGSALDGGAGTAGDAGSAAQPAEAPSADDGGCSCRHAGEPSHAGQWTLLGLAALFLRRKKR